MVLKKEGDELERDDQQPQGGLGYQVSCKKCLENGSFLVLCCSQLVLIVVHERVTWLLESFLGNKQGGGFIGTDRLWFARERLATTCLNSSLW